MTLRSSRVKVCIYDGSCVLVGTCGSIKGLWIPNILHLRPNVMHLRPNVPPEGHDITLGYDFRV
jgi:hypothetical protein